MEHYYYNYYYDNFLDYFDVDYIDYDGNIEDIEDIVYYLANYDFDNS